MKLRPTIEAPFEVKSDTVKVKGDFGYFEGTASPFGELDQGNDIVMHGAFAKSLATYESKNRKVPMLWQHDPHQPIGVYTDLKETDDGLVVRGECNLKTQRGAECHALMQQGALTGLSIGYKSVVEDYDERGVIRKLHEVNLWEISPVTFPMADSARAEAKAIQELQSLSDVEAYLRDACGFSRKEATAFTARVKAIAAQRDSANGDAGQIDRIRNIIRSL